MSKRKTYQLRNPLAVRGGIRAQHTSTGQLRVWWSRRWMDMMEQFRLGARLGRGRNYAEAGQVSDLVIEQGVVNATVQGAQKEPYTSRITFKTLDQEGKATVLDTLREKPVLIARLLVGDLPLKIESILLKTGCPLFPEREHDVKSRCNCPDWANPCKHLAAVYYLLGEEIAKNPMLLLKIRGITIGDIFNESNVSVKKVTPPDLKREPLPLTASFYGQTQPEVTDFGEEEHTGTSAPLVHRLGSLPFWRGQERFIDTLENLYDRAALRGWKVWMDEPLDVRREEEKTVIKGANLSLRHKRMTIDATML
ncbi:MAG: SWIM zinc finger family protein [Kiritimatiellae bacterium]|nr:SWIM zinc finger family protein [Kiritimatiellia bacterium]